MSTQLHSREAEIAILTACLQSKTARQEARRHITGRDFYEPWHEEVWDAIGLLERHGKNIDLVTLNATLKPGTRASAAVLDLVGGVALPDHIGEYASIVRSWATKRRLVETATRVAQHAMSPDLNATGYAATVVSEFAAIRDSGVGAEDITAVTVTELLAGEDDEPDWLIPGLLERRDRLMLTGEEGLGKSHMLRQIAILASAGLDPFEPSKTLNPIRSLIFDCENTWSQVRRKVRPAVDWARRWGEDPAERMMVDCTSRIDISRDKDLSRIHQLLDAWQPDLVVIGPLYRLVPRALQNDDDTAPVLAALDTIRDRGCALLMEAHAGHAIGKGAVRDMRPRGSSSLLGWPEFGFGMRGIGTEGYADIVPWRGQREERAWPQRVRKAEGFRWLPTDSPYAHNGAAS